jgi:putative transposase
MPNHVHTVFTPLRTRIGVSKDHDEADRCHSLARIMKSIKGVSALEANRLLGRRGQFWAHESFDHAVRDEGELGRVIRYTINNPVKAGLVKNWRDWGFNYLRRSR